MGQCTTKRSSKSRDSAEFTRRAATTIASGAGTLTQIERDLTSPRKASPSVKCEAITQQHYISCFLSSEMADDPIARIARLEQACIRLKSLMEKEKLKKIASVPRSIGNQKNNKFLSSETTTPSSSQGTINLSNVNSTRPSFDNIPASVSNDIHCYQTIIKLADFIQEKAQRLWENPQDEEIMDALASLFWASRMLGIECLTEFQEEVSKELVVVENQIPIKCE